MATTFLLPSSSLVLVLLLQFSPCLAVQPRRRPGASHANGTRWAAAGATWYGPPNGDGSDGGACGYGPAVGRAPFSSLIAAGSPSVFKSGKGCGACYQVRCTKHRACSGKPVRVVITDLCPGGPCFAEPVHFDLSGTAISAMASPGRAAQLRAVGVLPVEFSRVPCEYPGRTVVFHVDAGSNPNYFAVVIEFTDGDGALAAVAIKEPTVTWRPMRESWGAVWKINSGPTLHAPFSIRLTAQHSGKTLVARDVIPAGWKPGATYRSLVNYD